MINYNQMQPIWGLTFQITTLDNSSLHFGTLITWFTQDNSKINTNSLIMTAIDFIPQFIQSEMVTHFLTIPKHTMSHCNTWINNCLDITTNKSIKLLWRSQHHSLHVYGLKPFIWFTSSKKLTPTLYVL